MTTFTEIDVNEYKKIHMQKPLKILSYYIIMKKM